MNFKNIKACKHHKNTFAGFISATTTDQFWPKIGSFNRIKSGNLWSLFVANIYILKYNDFCL